MTAFELLTERDEELIKDYIRTFAPTADRYDRRICYSDLETILREWNTQKSKDLVTLFGGKSLILKRFFTYTMTKECLAKEFDRLYEDNYLPLFKMRNILSQTTSTSEMIDFHYELLNRTTLIENAYLGESFVYEFLDGTSFKINKGMKPLKILHRILEKKAPEALVPSKYEKESDFEKFRNWHSQIFNQSHYDGELCLSIHPLDYLTMSDNDNGWESCMTWSRYNPGDYRAGTVECMNSPYIIIAYLHNPAHPMLGSNPKKWYCNDLPSNWEWNSKRWRELFLVQDGIISEIKGYPYQDETLTNTVLMWIKQLAKENLGWTYNDEELNYMDGFTTSDKHHYSLYMEPTYYMYNDFGTMPRHRMRINEQKLLTDAKSRKDGFECEESVNAPYINIPYGGSMTCMCCGTYIDGREDYSNIVLCEDCEDLQRCSCCGAILGGEEYWLANIEGPVCESCFDEGIRDDLTNEYYADEAGMYCIALAATDNNEDFYVCPLAQEITVYEPRWNEAYKRIFDGEPIEKYIGYGCYRYYITPEMIKNIEAALDAFGIDVDDYYSWLDSFRFRI